MTPREASVATPASERPSIVRAVALVASLGLFAAVAAGVLADGLRDSRRLGDERALYGSLTNLQRAEYVGSAFEIPPAFRRFRRVLGPGDRYAIVLPATVTPDKATLYHQYGLYYLYPAIAATENSQADAVLVLDPAQKELASRFRHVEMLGDGIWIGRRR